jgi:hypothetical protein
MIAHAAGVLGSRVIHLFYLDLADGDLSKAFSMDFRQPLARTALVFAAKASLPFGSDLDEDT